MKGGSGPAAGGGRRGGALREAPGTVQARPGQQACTQQSRSSSTAAGRTKRHHAWEGRRHRLRLLLRLRLRLRLLRRRRRGQAPAALLLLQRRRLRLLRLLLLGLLGCRLRRREGKRRVSAQRLQLDVLPMAEHARIG